MAGPNWMKPVAKEGEEDKKGPNWLQKLDGVPTSPAMPEASEDRGTTLSGASWLKGVKAPQATTAPITETPAVVKPTAPKGPLPVEQRAVGAAKPEKPLGARAPKPVVPERGARAAEVAAERTAQERADFRVGLKIREESRAEEKTIASQMSNLKKQYGGAFAIFNPEYRAKLAPLMKQQSGVSLKAHPAAAGALSSVPFYGDVLKELDAKTGGKASEAFEVGQTLPGAAAGKVGVELGKQIITYGAANQLLSKVPALANLGNSMAKALGLGETGTKVLSTQVTDLIIDNIAQAPGNVISAIKEDKTLSQAAKDLAFQNVFDIGFNLGIAGIAQAFKSVGVNPPKAPTVEGTPKDEIVKTLKSNMPPAQKNEIATAAKAVDSSVPYTVEEQLAAGVNPAKVQYFKGTPESIIAQLPKVQEGSMIKRSDIETFMREALDIPVARGRIGAKDALGVFKIGPEVIRLKTAKDMDTLFHEVGHFIDKKLNLKQIKELHNDLLQAAPKEYDNQAIDVRMGEGVAEFFRHYFGARQLAESQYPELYKVLDPIIQNDKNLSAMTTIVNQAIQNYANATPINRLLSNVSVGDKSPFRFNPKKIYDWFIDDLAPVNRAVKAVTGGQDINISQNPYEMARLAQSSGTGTARAFIEWGALSKTGDKITKVGKSLSETLGPVQKDLDNFRAYAIARRAKELQDRGIETGLDKNDVDAVLAQFKDNKRFATTMQDLITYQDNVLNYFKESGMLSEDAVQAMRELNKNYIPFNRVIDEVSAPGSAAITAKGIKRIKGSTRDIIDPLESVIKNTYLMSELAERNQVMRAFYELGQAFPGGGKLYDVVPAKLQGIGFELGEIKKALEGAGADLSTFDPEALASIFRPAQFQGKDVISAYIDGKPVYMQVFDKDLLNAIAKKPMTSEGYKLLVAILGAPARLQRAGATTLNLAFGGRNIFRDTVTAGIYSKYGFLPGVDTIRGLFDAVGKTDLYYKAIASGGLNNSLTSLDRDYLQKNLREIMSKNMADKTIKTITHPLDILRALGEFSENATRLGQFRKGVLKEGDSLSGIRRSALETRDLMDFLRGGSVSKEINKFVPFFNASMQGTNKLARVFKERPLQATALATMYITIPSVVNYAMNYDDPRYQRLSRVEKDLNWHIITDDAIYRIPKPYEAGVLFGTAFERVLDYIRTEDPKAFKGLMKRIKENMMPDMQMPFQKTASELKSNYSEFFDAPIVPPSEQGLDPELQYGPETTETAKMIGDLFNISPRQLEYGVKGLTGGAGQDILDLGDLGMRLAGKEMPTRPARTLPETVGQTLGLVTSPFAGGSPAVEDFYDELDKLEQAFASGKARGEFEEIADFKDGGRLQVFRQVGSLMSEISKQSEAIKTSTTLSPEAKRDALIKVQELRDTIASRVMGDTKKRSIDLMDRIREVLNIGGTGGGE